MEKVGPDVVRAGTRCLTLTLSEFAFAVLTLPMPMSAWANDAVKSTDVSEAE